MFEADIALEITNQRTGHLSPSSWDFSTKFLHLNPFRRQNQNFNRKTLTCNSSRTCTDFPRPPKRWKRSPHSPRGGPGLTASVRMAVTGRSRVREDARARVLLETVCPLRQQPTNLSFSKSFPRKHSFPTKLEGLASSVTFGPLTYAICFLIPTHLGTDIIIFLFVFSAFLFFFYIVFLCFIYC